MNTFLAIVSILNGVHCFVFDGTRAFGYSSEDVQMVIETMAAQGKEPTFCMGDDIPLAILSQKPHMLYDYFKQRFAQVCYNLFHIGLHRLLCEIERFVLPHVFWSRALFAPLALTGGWRIRTCSLQVMGPK